MPNQRAIARKLGLTQATVSLALRNDPSISKKTRERIQQTADAMGYRPNPMVTSLMERIRSGKEPASHGCIAVLVDAASDKEWFSHGEQTYRAQHEGYKTQATRRGYRAECFYLRAEGMSPEIIDRQLYARGITGLILAAPKLNNTPPRITSVGSLRALHH